ncbi:MAG TPA: AAA family ATPase [Gaiellaceae bacterium]|nr:AAA family ATPase [Gaiellaceae bacterium]
MPHVTPIGRDEELTQLVQAAESAAGGRGSIVFLEGPTGSGKSLLLKSLADAVAELPGDKRADVVSVVCYETGAGNPLGPFGEVLRALTSQDRRGEKAKGTLELIGRIAPPLVELIPVIGKLAAVGVKAASDLGVYALGGNREAQQLELAADVALALRSVAAESPLVVIVDDAQWIDAASTEVVARLAQDPEAHPLLLVVAYDPGLVTDKDLLARARSAVATRAGVTGMALPPLTVGAVETFLADRYGAVPDGRLAAWLRDQTEGSPLYLTQYLALLEEQGVLREGEAGWALDGTIAGEPGDWSLGGALAAAQTPDSLLDLLRPRVADLDDDERSLLETGAVQGRRFLSTVLVRLLDAEEDAILDRLRQISERRRMIETEDVEDWWSDRSALYTFDPGVLQELLYDRYAKSPYERRRRHKAVAEALESLIEGDDPPPRVALLEIARHYEAAGSHVQAATRFVEVAESCFAEGADREAAAHAERAVAALREPLATLKGEEQADARRLLVRALLLVLLGGEPTWNVHGADAAAAGVQELAREAEEIAEATGDPKLRANACYARALVQIAFGGLEEGLASYREALELARAAEDPLAEFAILMNYGHQLNSVSLQEGWEQLQQAHALLTGGALDGQLGEEQRALQAASLETLLGVGAFDLGRYGEALDLLVRSAAALREARRRDESSWALAFLAQVQTAVGDWEAAEASLRGGIDLLADLTGSVGVRAYLRALLGRLYLEQDPPRPAEAREALAAAREEAAASGYVPTMPLVDAMWAELLLAEGTPESLAEADQVLRAMETHGWARSEIESCTMLAQVALASGLAADAVEPSTKAVTELEGRGGAVPALRSEEVLWTHARALAATGSAEAETYAAKAAEIVKAKAESLPDPEARKRFETGVRLSREILAGL